MGEPDIRQIVAVFCFFKFWKQQGVELLVYLGKKEILFRFQKKNFAVEVADFAKLQTSGLVQSFLQAAAVLLLLPWQHEKPRL